MRNVTPKDVSVRPVAFANNLERRFSMCAPPLRIYLGKIRPRAICKYYEK